MRLRVSLSLFFCLFYLPFVYGLTSVQHHRADQLISVFENESLQLRYDYVEDLGDGRGYTAGRAGFCTGTGDLLLVVERYTGEDAANPLAKYLPRLRVLAQAQSGSIKGLSGFVGAWRVAARDLRFRMVQDRIVGELYYQPALAHAGRLKARMPLTEAALFEAIIQHGDGEDPDGLAAIISRATSRVGGTPASGVAETVWLNAFLDERRADLLNATDPSTRAEWRESVGRADVMLQIFHSGNLDFHGPILVNPFGRAFQLP